MSWNPNIPQSTDKLSNSQPQLLGNFQAINTGFSFNHVALNLGADAGKHNLLTMPQQTFPQTVAGSDLLMYVGLEPLTAQSQIYFLTPAVSSGGGNGIPFTAVGTDASTFGWTYIPSGVQIKWGNFGFSGAVPATVTMQGPHFASSTSYQVIITCSTNNATTYSALNINGISFTFSSAVTAAETYSYVAIGT